ncbi:hypothetical protein [Aeromicrobium ginsengisoli]|uniref:Uncharacterized protein n=1 Tax=Aeromicrobium ginsengisoli TaxID=363867 RepID=A0A5M4FFX0_9ACTN|nr:hypothetical protein [Aeromicrobium ginsengisoli]KAA1397761.1 hypothetical protein ESP70_010455 [Aeromicrobium ginsengisoli]
MQTISSGSAKSIGARKDLIAFLATVFPHVELDPTELWVVADTLLADHSHVVQAGLYVPFVPDATGADPRRVLVRHAVNLLYARPATWALTGFEGPSTDLGGYVCRGFDDLDWLPEPRVTEHPAERIGTAPA